MFMNSLLNQLVGLSSCLLRFNSLYGVNLTLNDLFLMCFVRFYNAAGEKVGISSLFVVFKLNSRCCSLSILQASIARLEGCGFLTRGRRGSGRSLIALTCTKLGLQALKDFEELVQNYKVAGVPGSS